jgi:hypothetical protein
VRSHESVGPERIHLRGLARGGHGVGARWARAATGHDLAARPGVVVRQPKDVAELVRGDAGRVVALGNLLLVNVDVAVAVTVGLAVGALPVVGLVEDHGRRSNGTRSTLVVTLFQFAAAWVIAATQSGAPVAS